MGFSVDSAPPASPSRGTLHRARASIPSRGPGSSPADLTDLFSVEHLLCAVPPGAPGMQDGGDLSSGEGRDPLLRNNHLGSTGGQSPCPGCGVQPPRTEGPRQRRAERGR